MNYRNSWIIILVFLLGCSKDPNGKSFSDLKTQQSNYMPSTPDRVITEQELAVFQIKKNLGIEAAAQSQRPWLTNSADLFRMAEHSFVLAQRNDSLNAKAHNQFAHKILDLFYSNKQNSTQYTTESSMYLPAALGFEGERIYEKFKKIGSREDSLKLERIFSSPCLNNQTQEFCHSLIWPKENPNLEPRKFVESIISYMNKTVELMRREGIAEEFVSGFSDKIKKDYLEVLGKAVFTLKDVGPSRELILNTQDLVAAIEFLGFLPEKIYQLLSEKLVEGHKYALILKGEKPYSKDYEAEQKEFQEEEDEGDLPLRMKKQVFEKGLRILNVIGNIWLDLKSDEKRLKYIGGANLVLYSSLTQQSSPFIQWVSGRVSHDEYGDLCSPNTGWIGCKQENYNGDAWRYGYVERLAMSCHENIKKEIDLWLDKKNGSRQSLKERNLALYTILTSFQDSVFKNVILKNYVSEEQEVEIKRTINNKEVIEKVTVKSTKFKIPTLSGSEIMYQFTGQIAQLCLEDVQVKIEKALNEYILATLDEEIRKYSSDIEKIVSEKTLSNQKDIVDAVSTSEKFKAFFEKMAVPIMDKMLFAGQTRNGLESSKVSVLFDAQGKMKTQRQNESVFETSAETLGVSLSANYYRLLTLPKVKGVSPIKDAKSDLPNEYYVTVFEQINKMLSMIGFRRMDKSQQKSLHRRFHGPIDELDVYKYDCTFAKKQRQQSKMQAFVRTKDFEDFVDWRENCEGYERSGETYYSLPDRLAITGTFEPDDSVFGAQQESSVLGQSEVIRGGSLMLKYFQDWKTEKDDYDLGIGAEVFSNVHVFPKHAFVNLTIALATVPVRGFTKLNSNLYLFNANGEEFVNWAEKGMPPQNSPNPVALAAIADVLTNGSSRILKAADLAHFIIAIDEFLKATDGVEKTKATVINPPNKKIKENLNSLIEGRRLLKLMMAGVSNLLTSQFQDPDGGFWHTFDLDNKTKGDIGSLVAQSNKRALMDQVLVIDALLRTYGQWKGTGVYLAAIDAYHFMNRLLFNPTTGFYNTLEGVSSVVKPDQYLHIIRMLDMMRTMHPIDESREQAERMMKFYESKWLNWSQAAL